MRLGAELAVTLRAGSERIRPLLYMALLYMALLACALTGCHRGSSHQETAAAHPDVLLVTIDTLRADEIGAYGFALPSSPAIDRLASRGVLFERAIAAAPSTAPSHASIFTSRWVRRHSIGHSNGATQLSGQVTMAQLFRDAGYATAAFVGNVVLQRRIGLDAGFDRYDDELPSAELNRPDVFERKAAATVDRAIEWVEGSGARPMFMWVHLQDPHGPYTPPAAALEPFLSLCDHSEAPLPVSESESGYRAIPSYQKLEGLRRPGEYKARYAGELRYADEQLQRLLDRLGERRAGRPLLIALTGDHGESMGEQDIWFAHGHTAMPELAQVPLIFVAPGIEPARRAVAVSHVDIMPTLLELAGLPPAPESDGISLAADLRADRADSGRLLYCDGGEELAAYAGDAITRIRFHVPPPGASGPSNGVVTAAYAWPRSESWSFIKFNPPANAVIADYLRFEKPVVLASDLSLEDRERMRALGYMDVGE